MKWPKVQVTSDKTHAGYKFIGGGWLPMLMAYLMLSAIFLPYFIVLIRGSLNPILPFVSQAAGSPPQSGIFSLCLSLSCLTAFIGLNLLHLGLRIKKCQLKTKDDRQSVALLNKVLLIPGHIAIMGMLTVSAYPIDFHRHNEDWMVVTIIPHLIGATSIFLGGISFCLLFTRITAILHPEKKNLLYSRILLMAFIIVCAVLHGITVLEGFMAEYWDENRLKSCVAEKIDYNMHYLVCSVSEWLLVILFVVFFMTMKEEAKEFSFDMMITMNESSTSEPQSHQKQIETKKDENHNVDDKQEKQDVIDQKS